MAATIIQQKRFTNEKALLAREPLHYTTAYPDKTNPLIWYCLIIGQKGTPYYGGQYIFKVVHSPKYPAEPPDYYFLTPSGRYEVEKKICLTNSSYHKGEWSSTWNIKTILISFYSIFLDNKEHGISHITNERWSAKVCEKLASESIAYNKKHWASILDGFDFTHLKDDAPNITLIKPKVIESDVAVVAAKQVEEIKAVEETKPVQLVEKAKQVEEVKPIKLVEEDKPINEVKEVKEVEGVEEVKVKKTRVKKITEAIKEVVLPKEKTKKVKTNKIKIVDFEDNQEINKLNEEINKQMTEIKNLEEDVKMFK
jgi:ubiquitin-conjugating enzyme E2 J2